MFDAVNMMIMVVVVIAAFVAGCMVGRALEAKTLTKEHNERDALYSRRREHYIRGAIEEAERLYPDERQSMQFLRGAFGIGHLVPDAQQAFPGWIDKDGVRRA